MNERLSLDRLATVSGVIHKTRYEFASAYTRDNSVVDIACGLGYGSALLAETGAKHVTGVDIDEGSIHTAAQQFASPSINFLNASGENLPLESQSCDVVVSFETIEHTRDPKQFLDELHRILKPGGKLIISTPNRTLTSPMGWLKPGNRFHRYEFSQKQFADLIAGKFVDLKWFGQQTIEELNLHKYKKVQRMSQLARVFPELLIDRLKSNFPRILKSYRAYIGDMNEPDNPGIMEVRPIDDLAFAKHMIIVASKNYARD